MRREKLYKNCIKKFLFTCSDGFPILNMNNLQGSAMSQRSKNVSKTFFVLQISRLENIDKILNLFLKDAPSNVLHKQCEENPYWLVLMIFLDGKSEDLRCGATGCSKILVIFFISHISRLDKILIFFEKIHREKLYKTVSINLYWLVIMVYPILKTNNLHYFSV